MASMLGRLITLARSPQGKKLMAEAKEAARDPKNRERLAQLKRNSRKR